MKINMNEHNDDLKRFKLLLEYDFYVGEEDVFKPKAGENAEIITEEPPQDDLDGAAPTDDTEGGEEPLDNAEGGEDMSEPEMGGEELPEPEMGGEELPEPEGMNGDDLPEPEMGGEELPEPEAMEDEVELDITQLVQGTEQAKASSDEANAKIEALMAKFDELSSSLDRMSVINAKMEKIEHEIEKRNPTPEEKLEMRSLSSYPYNLKLTDFWSEKEGNYDAMKHGENGQGKKEYVLTQNDVDRDYNSNFVKDSFNAPEVEEEDKFDAF